MTISFTKNPDVVQFHLKGKMYEQGSKNLIYYAFGIGTGEGMEGDAHIIKIKEDGTVTVSDYWLVGYPDDEGNIYQDTEQPNERGFIDTFRVVSNKVGEDQFEITYFRNLKTGDKFDNEITSGTNKCFIAIGGYQSGTKIDYHSIVKEKDQDCIVQPYVGEQDL
jgi:hypothetical protein